MDRHSAVSEGVDAAGAGGAAPEPEPPAVPKEIVLLPPGSEGLADAAARAFPAGEPTLHAASFGLEQRQFNGCACVFLLVWCGLWYGTTIASFAGQVAKGGSLGGMWFLVPFWLLGLVALYSLVWMLFGRVWLFFEPNRLRRCRKLFGWRRTETIERASVAAVEEISGEAKNGRWYALRVRRDGAEPVELTGRSGDRAMCEWLGRQVAVWAGMPYIVSG